ncbi:MAG TPA: lysylphosphatidylglycerol synthase transmembrane domain-containing protein [Pyrinomonadaceae bacterium]|nr:lysylphosphatidylglycerol synthase transmembrane domain-containing protein [Pyrinomonadaceae bacterium]
MRKHLKFIALVVLAALILWWFGRGLNWAEVRESVRLADARLLASAILVVSLTYLIRAYRWRALLAPLTPASLRELFVATTVGFGSVFLFGRAGEVVRPVVLPLRDRRVRPAASFVTIMVERLCDSVAVVVLFAANLLWFRAPASDAAQFAHVREAGLILLVVALVGVGSLIWFERRSARAVHWLDQRLARLRFVPERVRHAAVSTLEQLATALQVLAHPRELLVTATWTALLWLAITLANGLVIRAFGLPFGFGETVFVLGWALVGSLVPTPGGAAGAFHAATAAGLIFLGVAREKAAAASIVIHLVDFAPAVLFGLYYVLRGDINIRRLRELTSSEAVEHAVEDEKLEPVAGQTKAEEEEDLEALALGK